MSSSSSDVQPPGLPLQDPDLREAALLLQQGLEAPSVEREEAIWTQIIDKYGSMDKPWVPDVVGRAWGNRGNARSRQVRCAVSLMPNAEGAMCRCQQQQVTPYRAT